MATKRICDVCGQDWDGQRDYEAFDFRGKRPHIQPRIHTGDWGDADLCWDCLTDAVNSQDKRPRPVSRGSFRFLVWLNGVKSIGPHAEFVDRAGAEQFLRVSFQGGRIEETGY